MMDSNLSKLISRLHASSIIGHVRIDSRGMSDATGRWILDVKPSELNPENIQVANDVLLFVTIIAQNFNMIQKMLEINTDMVNKSEIAKIIADEFAKYFEEKGDRKNDPQ